MSPRRCRAIAGLCGGYSTAVLAADRVYALDALLCQCGDSIARRGRSTVPKHSRCGSRRYLLEETPPGPDGNKFRKACPRLGNMPRNFDPDAVATESGGYDG